MFAITTNTASLNADANLVLVGVFAPKKKKGDAEEDKDEDDDRTNELSGEAKAALTKVCNKEK